LDLHLFYETGERGMNKPDSQLLTVFEAYWKRLEVSGFTGDAKNIYAILGIGAFLLLEKIIQANTKRKISQSNLIFAYEVCMLPILAIVAPKLKEKNLQILLENIKTFLNIEQDNLLIQKGIYLAYSDKVKTINIVWVVLFYTRVQECLQGKKIVDWGKINFKSASQENLMNNSTEAFLTDPVDILKLLDCILNSVEAAKMTVYGK